MKRSILLIALMAVLSFASPVSEHGKLSVSDGKILDKNGQPYVLRGMSMFWNIWTEGSKYYNQNTVTTLAGNDWKANVVRVAIGNTSVDDAKNFMDWTASSGIYVIVDWHYHTINSSAESFFTSVASYAKQKNYNHVLYEIFNEPCSGQSNCGQNYTWAQIKSYAENIIDKIRAQDSEGLIIVGTPSFSSDLGSARANPITGTRAKNILYTLHFYSSDPMHESYQNSLSSAGCAKFPVFVTEWGVSQADGGGSVDWTKTNTWMSLVESMGISWANWSYTDKCETSAALCGGMSASGKYVQRIMKNRNNGGGITSANGGDNVNLRQIDAQCSGQSGTQAGEKNGIVKVGGSTTDAVNFLSMTGARDSVEINDAPVLQNTAATFNVGYKLTEIPGPGTYRMRIKYGSTAAATVSWSGSGVESGSFELASTSKLATWKTTSYFDINITATGETPLNLTFNSGGANNFALVTLQVSSGTLNPTPSSNSTDQSSSSSSEDTTPIDLPQIAFTNSLNAMQNSVNLQVANEANFKVFDLKGNIVRSLNFSQGIHTVQLGDLPKGLYIVKAQFGSQREILRVPVR